MSSTTGDESDAPTALRPAGDETPTLIVSPPSSAGRFTPGTILGHRYRIIAMLGRGGMGEVYRADDLRLGQQVALKFLPRGAGSPADHERLMQEVRIGREISHPNVCRLYDIVDFEGRRRRGLKCSGTFR